MREQCGWVPAVGKDNKPQATPLEERAPPAVPDLSGTRGWSHGGQFFHGQSVGVGRLEAESGPKGSRAPLTFVLLTSCSAASRVPNRPQTGPSPRPKAWGWGPCSSPSMEHGDACHTLR